MTDATHAKHAIQSKRIHYTGSSRTLVWLYLKVLGLSLITLFFYLPSGIVEIRKYIWSHIEIDGEALDYDGSKQTQLSWKSVSSGLAAAAFVYQSIPFVALCVSRLSGLKKIANVPHVPCLDYLAAPFVVFGGTQYRLHHTRYKGVRFALEGDAQAYAKLYVRRVILAMLTLGYLYPAFAIDTTAYALSRTRWGSQPVTYTGTSKAAAPLYRHGLVLTVLSCGLYLPWYIATLRNYHVSCIGVGGVTLRSHQTGSELMSLWAGNGLIRVLSFGLAAGWATTRYLRYAMDTVTFEGDASAVASMQPDVVPQTGLADLLASDRWIV